MIYVGTCALIYLHTILGDGIVSRDGLPRGVLPSGILKMEKYCPGLKVRFPQYPSYDRDEYVDRDSFWIHLINEDDLIKLRAFSIVQVKYHSRIY